MSRVTIIIDTDNDAFQGGDGHELNRMLGQALRLIDEGDAEFHPASLRDSNGNTCGTVEVSE